MARPLQEVRPSEAYPPARAVLALQRHASILSDKIETSEWTAKELRMWIEMNPNRAFEFVSAVKVLEQEADVWRQEHQEVSTQLRLTDESSIDGYGFLTNPNLPASISKWLKQIAPSPELVEGHSSSDRQQQQQQENLIVQESTPPASLTSVASMHSSKMKDPRSDRELQQTPQPQARGESAAGQAICIVCGDDVAADLLETHVNAHFSPRGEQRRSSAASGKVFQEESRALQPQQARPQVAQPQPSKQRLLAQPPQQARRQSSDGVVQVQQVSKLSAVAQVRPVDWMRRTSDSLPAHQRDPRLEANDPLYLAANNMYFICPSCNQSYPKEALKIHTAVCVQDQM